MDRTNKSVALSRLQSCYNVCLVNIFNNNIDLRNILPYSIDVFKQDLKAVRKALDSQNFERLNTLSNRIMSNAYILKGDSFGLYGFVIKDLSLLIWPLKQSENTKPISSATNIMASLISKFGSILNSPEMNNNELWSLYHTTLKMLRISVLQEDQDNVYTSENTLLTHEGILALINLLKENKNLLTVKANDMLNIMAIEINRLFVAYGISGADLKIRAIVLALGLIEDYTRKDAVDESKFKSNIEGLIFPFLDKLFELTDEIDKVEVNVLNTMLWNMIATWRDLFLKYGEPVQYYIPAEQRSQQSISKGESQITLPPGTKDKLTDYLSKVIEDQLRKR